MKQTKFVAGMLALSLLLNVSPSAFAANGGAAQPALAVGMPMLAVNGGNYDYTRMNKDALASKYLDILTTLSEKDRAHVQSVASSIDAQIQDLITERLNKLNQAQIKSAASKPLTQEEFLMVRNDVLNQINAMKAKIEMITKLPEIGVVNNRTVNVVGERLEIDGQVKADFGPLKMSFKSVISTVEAQVETLIFNVELTKGGVIQQKGLQTINAALNNPFTRLQIEAMRSKVQGLAEIPSDIKAEIEKTLLRYQVDLMNQIVKTFGTTEQYRIAPIAAEKGMNQALKQMQDYFHSLSVIRKIYGVKTNVPKAFIKKEDPNRKGEFLYEPLYKKQWANWDFFSSTNQIVFKAIPVSDQAEQIDYQNQIEESLRSQEARVKKVLSFDGNVFSKITSAVTFLKGERPQSMMNVFLLKLLSMDIKEDILLGNAGGLRDFRDAYKERYYNTSDNEKYYRNRQNVVARILDPGSVEPSADGYDDVAVASNGAAGILANAGQSFGKIRDRMEERERMLATIELATAGVQRDNSRRRAND